MPAPFDYASASGYARARADWADYPTQTTPIQRTHLNRIDQALFDEKARVVNVKDYLAVGDDSTANATPFANAYSGASNGSVIYLPRGTYRSASFPTISKNYVTIIGDGQDSTIIKPSNTSGYFFDLVSAGKLRIEGLTIDGSLVTGTGQAIAFTDTSRCYMRDVCIKNYTANGNSYVMSLKGAMDNTFINVDFENNGQHLQVTDTATYPSNQNLFYGCKFQTVQWASGNAVIVEDSEGNTFHGCLVQGNLGLNTFAIVTNANELARGNQIVSCWFEDNGNAQATSVGIYIAGNSASFPVASTVIRDCFLGSTVSDKPNKQISNVQYTNNTYIDGNYSNLGTAVFDGTGALNTVVTDGNNFAGAVTINVPTVAAAATTMVVPRSARILQVSGTTTITTIPVTYATHVVRLHLTSTAQLTDGGNLKLAGDFTGAADRTIQLYCDGTNWVELGRSAN